LIHTEEQANVVLRDVKDGWNCPGLTPQMVRTSPNGPYKLVLQWSSAWLAQGNEATRESMETDIRAYFDQNLPVESVVN